MNYKVKIPEKFKVRLSQRFDFLKAQKKTTAWGLKIREINIKCPLCEDFHYSSFNYLSPLMVPLTFSLDGINDLQCGSCPFWGFETKKSKGCFVWLDGVLPGHDFSSSVNVWWKESDNRKVKEQLSLLRKKAKELIEWV